MGSSVGVSTRGQASCPLRVIAFQPGSLDNGPLGLVRDVGPRAPLGYDWKGRVSTPFPSSKEKNMKMRHPW
nr:hypothetical protein Iba_chr01aCG4000 [Ipomoea batatas]